MLRHEASIYKIYIFTDIDLRRRDTLTMRFVKHYCA